MGFHTQSSGLFVETPVEAAMTLCLLKKSKSKHGSSHHSFLCVCVCVGGVMSSSLLQLFVKNKRNGNGILYFNLLRIDMNHILSVEAIPWGKS